jgi:diphosphate--fructose-6-phosphate 1-phosphotransferase
VRVGVVLSGGQAPGGHNVIAGIFDAIKSMSSESVLIGFLNGPHGVFSGNFVEIDGQFMDLYRNTGGFDIIGSGRHKIERPDQFAASQSVCETLNLDGLVVIGGDDSNTNAAVLAEYFAANGCRTCVVGAPKTIDGDLKNEFIPISFGFDTACKTYSELIGNVALDAASSQKYYHFVRLMGRSASHIALECALQTRPNACLIGEEVVANGDSLSGITQSLVQMIVTRAAEGKDYGVVLLPEGLIEFIPEFNTLINEINEILGADDEGTDSAAPPLQHTEASVLAQLSNANKAVFSYLPANIKQQLMLDRDPHGNVQVAKIETERLLASTVAAELEHLRQQGRYDGNFQPQFHAYGYEGRSGLPSVFDSTYCYTLGNTAAILIMNGFTKNH